ncbi:MULTISPECIES: tail fiber domain-containing protein [unclassified Rhizobium]|uniref:tail fiber domain-containing protein n=1 Tax=unclassified Rhizobium TaxID=2613769 RepID=UPI001C83CB03|nr:MULTISPECIES: tail fiber domain-containing protein [unclassified Rhizobium]MBX5217245.1 tail fiber domain-containing protein [Rhizobium sp. NLR9a]MBX5245619.1 tail fiber domain-containing protein [Rhizobium sp. NLR3b]MBX5273535.1 tail fiber domain-containing protein [Rhizobium sp. NLR13a]MBX5279915.1 tail fiber domain-containing protein [Rhizobium sp. NLR10a]MBX5291829.1 tail fiber domain-containing protein [Rhizobium sp. NLR15a]
MVSTPKAPKAPDPTQTAAAQTATNVDTAIANAGLSHTNQYTPDGSLEYRVSGYQTMTDQNGKTYRLPTYSAYQTYSPENQAIYDQTQQTQLGLARLANDQTAKVSGILGTNVDLSAGNVDKYVNDHWRSGFDDQWNRDQASLEQSLADKGIAMGSAAYDNAMRDFSTRKQAASDQYLGDMYSNAQNSILTERNQPLNEISALMSGSQVHQPSYVNTPATQLPTVDQAGLINENFNQKMGLYNQQLAQSNAATGGLFGLGGSLLGGWAKSDRRLKEDIRRVGTLDNGLPVYAFRYKEGGPMQIGLMSDDVREIHPDAVFELADGFDRVNYERAVA